jgi:hypothetical protein
VVVLTEASHKERKERRRKVGLIVGGLALGLVLLAALLPVCHRLGPVCPVFVLALVGFLAAGICNKHCKANNNGRCSKGAHTAAAPVSSAQPVPQQPAAAEPAVNFREQLQTLFSLGFKDVRRNVDELQRAGGDLSVAVQALLSEDK